MSRAPALVAAGAPLLVDSLFVRMLELAPITPLTIPSVTTHVLAKQTIPHRAPQVRLRSGFGRHATEQFNRHYRCRAKWATAIKLKACDALYVWAEELKAVEKQKVPTSSRPCTSTRSSGTCAAAWG